MAEILAQLLILLVGMGLPLILLVTGFVVGTWQERRHFEHLAEAEQELAGMLVADLKTIPENWRIHQSLLVCGEVAIANDRFKSWLARWINLFGGRVAPFETLVERGRREALVRLQQEARRHGCNVVWNVRLSTMAVQSGNQGQAGGVEVLAYGTALQVDS